MATSHWSASRHPHSRAYADATKLAYSFEVRTFLNLCCDLRRNCITPFPCLTTEVSPTVLPDASDNCVVSAQCDEFGLRSSRPGGSIPFGLVCLCILAFPILRTCLTMLLQLHGRTATSVGHLSWRTARKANPIRVLSVAAPSVCLPQDTVL